MGTLLMKLAALAAALTTGHAHHAVRTLQHAAITPRQYAYKLARQYGWQGEWNDIEAIIVPESGWDPCSYNPQHHNCGYEGSSSCGIPQAQPCPTEWRGRLWQTRFAQVRYFFAYVKRRYGSPANALAFRRVHHWY